MQRYGVLGALLVAVWAGAADAHYVWLERDGNGPARAYLGEWIDDVREKTGGLLDRIKAPRVFVGAEKEALRVKRNDDHLEISSKHPGDVRLIDDSMAARADKEKGGATKTVYYARAGRTETTARLELELVPTTPNGSRLTLLFLGAPLAKAQVTLIGPVKWQKPLVTDEKGQVTLPTPWAGRYVLEVTHFDERPGGDGADKFDRTRHITSLSFVQQDGMRWSEKTNLGKGR